MKMNNYDYLGQQKDVSDYFYEIGNTYFNVQNMSDFDEESLTANIHFKRYERKGRIAFNLYTCPFEESQSWSFPPSYAESPKHQVRFSFTASNVFRMEVDYKPSTVKEESIMLQEVKEYKDYQIKKKEDTIELKTRDLQVSIGISPFRLIIKDKYGKVLTKTFAMNDGNSLLNCNPIPFSYVRSASDMRKYPAASFQVSPDEHFYGTGENFTKLDKTGQKIVLWTKDANGVQTQDMYKPIPFYMSSRGYGIFTHTGGAVTFDLGHTFQEAQTIYTGEENLDLFVMAGTPKEILSSYTEITGKPPVPPLWSFGLWMSRITYNSEEQARDVAKSMESFQIPCDVIHLDTGWFEHDWRCDYEFSATRFENPVKLIKELRESGLHISLWQIPYFTPDNPYYDEIIAKGYAITDGDGGLPTDDAIIDFTNKAAVTWYQDKLKGLFDIGVEAIKVDFGEAAPMKGAYANGHSGQAEHNLYPLRYNKAVAEVTQKETGESIIWARSAWAGSQRYPIHWGGDCENTDMGMLSSLRGGLSLGMSGFSFWSHDAGGFVKKSPEELYSRWMFMAVFGSHMRCHGAPPKEPWHYSDEFLALFRKQVSFRYALMPYIYAQAQKSAREGLPMMRSMFLEFPQDPGCYALETQYMFGEDILVAPMFEQNMSERKVYFPKGRWLNLHNPAEVLDGQQWHLVKAGALGGVAFVREGAVIPMVPCAQNTAAIDWSTLKYYWFTEQKDKIMGTGLEVNEKNIFQITHKLVEKKNLKLVQTDELWLWLDTQL